MIKLINAIWQIFARHLLEHAGELHVHLQPITLKESGEFAYAL